jgi:hypothetical protein
MFVDTTQLFIAGSKQLAEMFGMAARDSCNLRGCLKIGGKRCKIELFLNIATKFSTAKSTAAMPKVRFL